MRVLCLFGGVAKFGAERSGLETLLSLKRQGAEVRLVVSDAPWAEVMQAHVRQLGFEFGKAPILIHLRRGSFLSTLVSYPWVMLRASIALAREVASFRPTHLQASGQMFILTFLPYLLFSRTPLVYRVDEKPIVHNLIWRTVWNFIARRAQMFLCVSRYMADLVRKDGVDDAKIRVIYNRPPSRTPDEAALVPAFDEQDFHIAFVGQISPTKGAGMLVEVFEKLLADHPDVRLVMVGRLSKAARDHYALQLRDAVLANPKLADKVIFTDFIEDVPAVLGRCQVLAAPSLIEEAMGNVVVEAKCVGVPAVVFPSGGLSEIVQHGVDGFVCRDLSAQALEEGLLYYLSDRGRAASHGQAARASLDTLVGDFDAQTAEVFKAAELGH